LEWCRQTSVLWRAVLEASLLVTPIILPGH
jgi:hypothetical protein